MQIPPTGVRPPEILVLVRTNRVGAVRSAGRKSRLPCLAVVASQNASSWPARSAASSCWTQPKPSLLIGIHRQKCWGSGPEWLFRSRGFAFPALPHKDSFYALSRTFGNRPLQRKQVYCDFSVIFLRARYAEENLPKVGCFET